MQVEQMSANVPNEIRYYGRSFGNPAACLFWRNGELYCSLTRERADLINDLYSRGIANELFQKRMLAPAEITALDSPGYDITLRVTHPPRISYVYEWCPEMWKAAALGLIDLLSLLSSHRLTLRNPHPWNLQYFNGQPVYMDIGSIVPFTDQNLWGSYDKLCHFLVHPLLLNAMNQGHAARRMLHDVHQGILPQDFPTVGQITSELKTVHRGLGAVKLLDQVRKLVEQIEVPDSETTWSGYHGDWPLEPTLTWGLKPRIVHRLLSVLRPKTVTDLACNLGWYSMLAESLRSEVTSMDNDEVCVNRLYCKTRRTRNNVLPLVMDFTNPSPGYGVANDWFPPATERFRSEMVLGLAVEHHFVFGKYRLTFDQVARGFSSFTTRWLIVEFIPPGSDTNANPKEWRPESEAWYNLDSFTDAFRREFETVTILQGDQGHRRLLLCEKRS